MIFVFLALSSLSSALCRFSRMAPLPFLRNFHFFDQVSLQLLTVFVLFLKTAFSVFSSFLLLIPPPPLFSRALFHQFFLFLGRVLFDLTSLPLSKLEPLFNCFLSLNWIFLLFPVGHFFLGEGFLSFQFFSLNLSWRWPFSGPLLKPAFTLSNI